MRVRSSARRRRCTITAQSPRNHAAITSQSRRHHGAVTVQSRAQVDAPTDLIVSVAYNRTKAPPTPLPHLLPVRFGYFDPNKSPTTYADGPGPAYGDAHKRVNVTVHGTNFAPPTRGMACAVVFVSPSDLLMTARRRLPRYPPGYGRCPSYMCRPSHGVPGRRA